MRSLALAAVVVFLTADYSQAQTLNINVYSQNDARWKSDKMGISGHTLGGFGCYATCLSAAYRVTPKTLNTWLSANNGYTATGDMNHPNEASYDGPGGLKYSGPGTLPNTAASVGNGISRGAVYVVRSRRFSEHWVLVYDSTGGQSYYMDPFDGTTRRVNGSEGWVSYGAEARIYSFQ